MMIYFIWAIILFIFLTVLSFLVFPAHICIFYDSSFSIKIKILFISIRIFPFPANFIKNRNKKKIDATKLNEKKIKKAKNGKKMKEENSKKNSNCCEQSHSKNQKTIIDGTLNILNKIKFFKKVLNLSFAHSKKVLKRLHFKINYLSIGISGENAADIAVKYGKYRIVLANLLSYFDNINHIKKENINIYPNFLECEDTLKMDIDISSRLIFILYEMMIFAKNYVKISNEKNFT